MEKITPNDRRRAARGRLMQSGSLMRKTVSLKCLVLDVSPTGARVHLLTPEAVAETVLLHLPGGAVQAARRCWQNGNDAGFEFIESDEAS